VEWIWTSLIAALVRRLLPKGIRSALLEYAARKDNHLQRAGEQDRIKDKTVCIIERNLRGPDTP
jgi:hypothetical protein